jgi:hypothetical protein
MPENELVGTSRLEILEDLVEELLKEEPEEERVQEYLQMAGLSNTTDPIDRIREVLQALDFEEPNKEIHE